jgi:hypothetical protein
VEVERFDAGDREVFELNPVVRRSAQKCCRGFAVNGSFPARVRNAPDIRGNKSGSDIGHERAT